MITGLYSSAGWMLAAIQQQDVIATNLANANCSGYKRSSISFSAFNAEMDKARAQESALPNVACTYPVASLYSDSAPGVTQDTSNPTDLAIDGPGFFVVGTGQDRQLTRAGAFRLDNTGQLVSTDGRPVMGQDGPIRVNGSNWTVDGDGSVRVDGEIVNKLRIVRGIDSLSGQPGRETVGRVMQGHIESSNVSVVKEMATMITALRAYEANQKTIQSIDQTLDKVINQVGRA